MKSIEKLIEDASHDMFNPVLNFEIANKYEELNQTASAVSFYLRAAEYGYNTNPEIVYTSLLKMAHCFNDQAGRENSVTHALLQAIQYMPNRPEAYFLLSRFYERDQKWQQCYTFAQIGLLYSKQINELPADVDYPGEYGLIFEKAVSSWWLGKKEESLQIFLQLLKEDILDIYRSSIIYNIKMIDPNAVI
jgi:tetratricopeptide (TPR) repeat protein